MRPAAFLWMPFCFGCLADALAALFVAAVMILFRRLVRRERTKRRSSSGGIWRMLRLLEFRSAT